MMIVLADCVLSSSWSTARFVSALRAVRAAATEFDDSVYGVTYTTRDTERLCRRHAPVSGSRLGRWRVERTGTSRVEGNENE